MDFQSTPFKMVTFGRGTVKFDKDGIYSTTDKSEIKELKKFDSVVELKAKGA